VSPKNDNFLEKKIETLAENTSDDVDYTNVFENLAFLQEHPMDLNSATVDQLEQLMMLNDFQIANLINHREKFGKLLSVFELQAVEGYDLPLIYQMLPYVEVDRDLNRLNISLKDMMRYANQEIFFRVSQNIEQQKGFSPITAEELAANPNSRYLGSPQRLFTRYRYKYGNYVSFGFTAEKDAGEEFFKGSQKQGFDFMTGHIAIQNIGKLKSSSVRTRSYFLVGICLWKNR
jgi:hypothetical protein